MLEMGLKTPVENLQPSAFVGTFIQIDVTAGADYGFEHINNGLLLLFPSVCSI